MKYLSLFSGIEAASVAWGPLGFQPVAFSEIDKFPSAVLAEHYPHVANLGDVTKHKEWPSLEPDIVVGGSPCQAFSVAGLRRGLEDPRGNLTLTFLGVVNQYRPEWVVWENVPGVLSIDGGRTFGTFLRALAELGYGFAYRVLDAQFFGVAQRRRRVFVVANARDWRRAAAVLFEPESLRGDSPPSREEGERAAPSLAARTRGGGGLGTDAELDGAVFAVQERAGADTNCGPGGKGYRSDGSAYTLEARHHVQSVAHAMACHMVKGGDPTTDNYVTQGYAVRRLTPTECERLQGFPDGYTTITYRGKPACDGPRYKALGNSMAVPVMRWIGERIVNVNNGAAK